MVIILLHNNICFLIYFIAFGAWCKNMKKIILVQKWSTFKEKFDVKKRWRYQKTTSWNFL